MELAALQRIMEETYGERDRERGVPAAVAWLCEEIGEFAKATRKGSRAEQLEELADALAWLASIANQLELSMDEAVERYASGCPKCSCSPCSCSL